MLASVYDVQRLTYGTPDGRLLQKDLTFRLLPGQLLLISGSNGCGKSTLLKALLGKLEMMTGTVRCFVPSSKITYIPQLENTEVHLPLKLQDVLMISRLHYDEDRAMGFGLLRRDQLDSAWNTASGGERKRTLLTRALLRDPELLVLDEPMNHLDTESRKVMIRVMADFLKEENQSRAIVMVCHQGLRPEEAELFDIVSLNLDGRQENRVN